MLKKDFKPDTFVFEEFDTHNLGSCLSRGGLGLGLAGLVIAIVGERLRTISEDRFHTPGTGYYQAKLNDLYSELNTQAEKCAEVKKEESEE